MDWIERMNAAVAYLEDHLTEELDIEAVARVAHCSPYHFQRIFPFMTSLTLAEYVRRRRMSLAAVELRDPGARVLDVAIKYGYSSPTAFNRAFQAVHGIAPSLVRLDGTTVKSYPPVTFTMSVTGREELRYRVEEAAAFRVVGVSVQAEMNVEPDPNPILQLWEVAARTGILERLVELGDETPSGLVAVMVPDPGSDLTSWRYLLSAVSSKPVPDGMEEYTVAPYTWAIFPADGGGTEAMTAIWERIAKEWLPTSGYEYADGPDMEVYL
ncbi:MAG: AraC family transcriptional regulator, partial [Promicromonosporaceae bacterium]|nr:AraC family transcriptional regulator [Promicromonosporaceae bacterium]